MLSKLRRHAEQEQGFTLIELLVVILIIGILAAIAIPSFLNQKSKGQDAAAKSDARTAQTAMETYYTDNETYATDGPGLVKIEATLAGANNLVASGTVNTFTVSVDSKAADGGGTYKINRLSDGTVTRTCTNANKGGCKTGGVW